MEQKTGAVTAYICPMHADVCQPNPGKCPRCGMALVAENARFALLWHMFGNPLHIVVMLALMAVVMAAAMIFLR